MDSGIDPTTGDLTGQRITTLANAIYIRLITPLGSWWAAPALGSRLHELKREKDRPRVSLLAQQYATQALKPLLDNSRARTITVETHQPHNGLLLLNVEVVDAKGDLHVFQQPVKVL